MQETFPAEPNVHCTLGDHILQELLERLSSLNKFEMRFQWQATNIVTVRGSTAFLAAGVLHVTQGNCILIVAGLYRCSFGPRKISHKADISHKTRWLSKQAGLICGFKICQPMPLDLSRPLRAIQDFRPTSPGFRYYFP